MSKGGARRKGIGIGVVAAVLLGAAAWLARPDPEAEAQDALVLSLIQPAPPIKTEAEWEALELQRIEAGRYGGRKGPAAARAMVMALPDAPEVWAQWVVSSARDEGEGRLSPAEQAAVVGWLSRGSLDRSLEPSALQVARAWSQIAADDPNAVAATLPAPASMPLQWREDGLLAVIVAKDMVGQPADEELAALHATAPSHRRACLPLLRAATQAGRLREVERLGRACSAEGDRKSVV